MRPRLDTDWLAVDDDGHVALFMGGERGPIPDDADTGEADDALVFVERAVRARHEASLAGAYRGPDARAAEPVFDVPESSDLEPLHERPFQSYPHLVVVRPDARLPRMTYAEVAARVVPAVVFPAITDVAWDRLHDVARPGCSGCRVLDQPDDPRPRAPELVARAGLYVFAHTGVERAAPYRRVVSPSLPTPVTELDPIVRAVASRVRVPDRFEKTSMVRPLTFTSCG